MSRWFIWAFILALTQGSGTLASRARNTPSLWYHGACATFSHGCFFVALILNVDIINEALAQHQYTRLAFAFFAYTTSSTIGSLVAHVVAMRLLERGRNRVGTYDDPASSSATVRSRRLIGRHRTSVCR